MGKLPKILITVVGLLVIIASIYGYLYFKNKTIPERNIKGKLTVEVTDWFSDTGILVVKVLQDGVIVKSGKYISISFPQNTLIVTYKWVQGCKYNPVQIMLLIRNPAIAAKSMSWKEVAP